MVSIPVYIINIRERVDRLESVLSQFSGRSEFDIHIIEACKNKIGAVGLWQSIVNIVKKASVLEDDVIIVCEDDHMFTDAYDAGVLIREIKESAYLGVDLLLGGIGGFKNAVPITSNKFWIDSFWCTQFVIMYRTIFESILTYHFSEKDTADGVLSQLTSRKMVLYPFISVQRSFGYSDVTQSNNVIGNIEALFESATEKMKIYHDVFVKYYGK